MKVIFSVFITFAIAMMAAPTVLAKKQEPTGLPKSCRIGQIACESRGTFLRKEDHCIQRRDSKPASCGKKAKYIVKRGRDGCESQFKKNASCPRGYQHVFDYKRSRDRCFKKVRAYRCTWKKY